MFFRYSNVLQTALRHYKSHALGRSVFSEVAAQRDGALRELFEHCFERTGHFYDSLSGALKKHSGASLLRRRYGRFTRHDSAFCSFSTLTDSKRSVFSRRPKTKCHFSSLPRRHVEFSFSFRRRSVKPIDSSKPHIIRGSPYRYNSLLSSHDTVDRVLQLQQYRQCLSVTDDFRTTSL